MVIGLAIDLVFNCISLFIQIHYHDVPLRRVWFKCWKRHVIGNAIILMMLILYFTSDILSVFQSRQDRSPPKSPIKNCTLPFGNWWRRIVHFSHNSLQTCIFLCYTKYVTRYKLLPYYIFGSIGTIARDAHCQRRTAFAAGNDVFCYLWIVYTFKEISGIRWVNRIEVS